MAVQGAAARMMLPAMYWDASSGEIQAPKTWWKKRYAISAMENGFTSQLTKSVTRSPRGFRPTFRIAAKSTFIIIGVIISQMSTAMGTLIWLPSPNSRRRIPSMNPGSALPRSTPTTMQRPTQRLKKRSKEFNRFSLATGSALCAICVFSPVDRIDPQTDVALVGALTLPRPPTGKAGPVAVSSSQLAGQCLALVHVALEQGADAVQELEDLRVADAVVDHLPFLA